MACTEAYKEHIMYTFHGFCKVVIRNAAITAWRDQQRRHKRELAALRLRPRRGGEPDSRAHFIKEPDKEQIREI